MCLIARPLGWFGGILPQEKFSSFRLILFHFTPFYECVQSLVSSPFLLAARGVAESNGDKGASTLPASLSASRQPLGLSPKSLASCPIPQNPRHKNGNLPGRHALPPSTGGKAARGQGVSPGSARKSGLPGELQEVGTIPNPEVLGLG